MSEHGDLPPMYGYFHKEYHNQPIDLGVLFLKQTHILTLEGHIGIGEKDSKGWHAGEPKLESRRRRTKGSVVGEEWCQNAAPLR